MNTMKVVELRSIAKQHGLHGYSRLRKNELIKLIQDNGGQSAVADSGAEKVASLQTHPRKPKPEVKQKVKSNIMDEAILDIGVKPLQPTKPHKQKVWKWIADSGRKFRQNIETSVKVARNKINQFSNWILDHVPEPVIKLDPKIEKLKECIRKIYRTTPDFTPKLTEKAAKGLLKTFEIPGASGYDLESYLKDTKGNIVKMLEDNVEEMKGIKTKFIVKCEMQKTNIATGETILQEAYFHSDNGIITKSTHLSDTYNSMSQKVFESMAQYQRQGSNWTLNQVRGLDIYINRYAPLAGSSYIPLPAELAKKKAIINMKNSDDKCFTWSVLRALHPKEKHPERIDEELTNKEGGLNMRGIEYPVTLKAIDKFEGQNASISINVFGYEREVYPLRISETNHETGVDLLLISEGDIQHYCWIKKQEQAVVFTII